MQMQTEAAKIAAPISILPLIRVVFHLDLFECIQVYEFGTEEDFSMKKLKITLGENSVRLLIAVILMLVMSCSALAAPEAHQVGPYKVSFNMNTNANYQIQTNTTVYPFATVYTVVIATDNTTGASIGITKYKNLTTSTLETSEEIAALRMALSGINVTAPMEQVIDNNSGFLLSGTPFSGMVNVPKETLFQQAQYWLDSKNCECGPVSVGTTLVNIASTYPQDVMQGILGSIHVTTG